MDCLNLFFSHIVAGDIFHAAPNIDHSQEFVRKDIKVWLNWLRNDIGFDGWRLDFVRWIIFFHILNYDSLLNFADLVLLAPCIAQFCFNGYGDMQLHEAEYSYSRFACREAKH